MADTPNLHLPLIDSSMTADVPRDMNALAQAVDNAITGLINGAPGALDTLKELADALGDDPNFATTITNTLAAKAPLASPGLTGVPTAPTAPAGTNTTQIATMQAVKQAVDAIPVPDVSAALYPLEREVANLKAASSIANRVDQASGIFYDLMDGQNGGSIGKLDTKRTNVVGALVAGATTCTVTDATGLAVGMEVTFQDIVTENKREKVILTGVAGNMLTFPALSNGYVDKSVVYRSLVAIDKIAKTMRFGKANYPALENMSKLSDPDVLPAGLSNDVAISPDGVYIAAVSSTTSPYLLLYKNNQGALTKLPNPATLPPGAAHAVAFSRDSLYLAVGHDASPFMTIYKRSGDTFTKLANPSALPEAAVYGLSFSPDGTYLAVGPSTAPCINIYKRNGDVFTKLTSGVPALSSTVFQFSWTDDMNYLAAAAGATNASAVYKRSGDTFATLTLPAGIAASRGVAFTPDGAYLTFSGTGSPYLTNLKRTGDTFAKLADAAVMPSNQGNRMAGTRDGKYLVVGRYGTDPSALVYRRDGDTLTNVASPPIPTGTTDSVEGVAISDDASYLVLGLQQSPFIAMFTGGIGVDVLQADIRYNITPAANIKSIVAWADHDADPNFDLSGAFSIHASNEIFSSMTEKNTITGTSQEDQFVGNAAAANSKATLKITASRNSTAVNKNITQVMGAVGQ